MVVKIGVEVLLVFVILISGSTWWVLKKRDKLLDTMIEDKGYLERVLTPELLDQVAAGHPLVGGAVGEIGHEVNLRVVEASDRKAQMRLRQISLAFSLLAVFGSFWLGVWFYGSKYSAIPAICSNSFGEIRSKERTRSSFDDCRNIA